VILDEKVKPKQPVELAFERHRGWRTEARKQAGVLDGLLKFCFANRYESFLLREAEFEQPDSAKPTSWPALYCSSSYLPSTSAAATAPVREGRKFYPFGEVHC
jgi:hypothetical protein